MGPEEVATALIIGGAVVKSVGTFEAGEAREDALNLRLTQEQLASEQEQNIRDAQMKQVVSAQVAEQAARGIAPGSASFGAIQEDTFNQFAEDREARKLELSFKEAGIDIEKSNVQKQTIFGIGENLFKAGAQVAGTQTGGAQAASGATGNDFDQASDMVDKDLLNKDMAPDPNLPRFFKPKNNLFDDKQSIF